MVKGQVSLPLGDLEIAVMEHLWCTGSADVKTTYETLQGGAPRSLNTVQSTLERLARKGLLSRRKHSRAYVYSPRLSREDLLLQTTSQIAESLGANNSNALLAAFLNLADQEDDDSLDRLQRLIDERRNSETK